MKYVFFALLAGAILTVLFVLKTPLKWGLKLLINTALGLVMLFLFNLLGKNIGVTLGINLINGLVVGILGPVGLAVLLIFRWLTI